MVVVRAFGSAEDGCPSSDVRANVVAADGPGGRCTVCLTGTADPAAAEPLRLTPELVPVARQLVANGLAALAEAVTACREGAPAALLATAGELRLWVQLGDDRRRGAIALARRDGDRDTVVSAPRGADLHTALARVERFLRDAGFLQPLAGAG